MFSGAALTAHRDVAPPRVRCQSAVFDHLSWQDNNMAKPKKPTRSTPTITGYTANITLSRYATQADANVDTPDPRIAFFFHLGFAINQWAAVERELFHIFRFILGNAHVTTAAYLFYNKHQTISARFGLVSPLVEALLTKQHNIRWDAIRTRFDKESPFRNRLAHDPSTQIISSVGSASSETVLEVPPPFWEIHLEPLKLRSPKKPKNRQPISVAQIVEHINEVAELKGALCDFRQKLPKRLPRHS